MSSVTEITGFIAIDMYSYEFNEEILRKHHFSEEFPNIFVLPHNSGDKNPDYILFGASINHLNISLWEREFNEFVGKFKAFNAFVFISMDDGNTVGIRSYVLARTGNGIREMIVKNYFGDDFLNEESDHCKQFLLIDYLEKTVP